MTHSRTAGSAPLALALLLTLAGLTLAPPALAQPGDPALAEALFEEGRKLMDGGKYAEACPKLAESYRLDPAGGSLLNLAVCHEKEGKLATAWSEFKDALGMARRAAKPEREKLASERIQALAPRLNRLTIELAPGGDLPGLEITHNGTSLGTAAIGTALPVDGGTHEIGATAAGRRPWKVSVEMAREGDTRSVVIPVLESVSGAMTAPDTDDGSVTTASPAATSGAGATQRTVGYVVGGVGIAGTVVGAVFGIRAFSLRGESDDKCGDGDFCPNTVEGSEGLAANEAAETSATLANAFIGAGLGLIGVGLVVVLTAPSGEEPGPATGAWLSPAVGLDCAGLTLGGGW